MRKLTVKRNKSFVGSLIKIKIYAEDHSSPETEINGIPCRKLGDLKNAEEKTFEIGECELRIFAIADGASKNFCNDVYVLPEGTEDIAISGQPRYNIANGNAFRFDNNNSEEALANRKKTGKKALFIMIGAVAVGIIIGLASAFLGGSDEEKTFSAAGMNMTLTGEYEKIDHDPGFVAAWASEDVAVFAMKESFSELEDFSKYTAEDYAEALIYANMIIANVKTEDGLVYFEFEEKNEENQLIYIHRVYAYKSNDAFWMIEFAVLRGDLDKYSEEIKGFAKSVTFD